MMHCLSVDLKSFSAAHRLIKGYQGKCNHLHGHNYALRVLVAAQQLDESGLMVDFAVVRRLCDQWVQAELDHCTLVCQEDQPLLDFLTQQQQKHYMMPSNTSVECLAADIYRNLQPLVKQESQQQGASFYLRQVQLWESKTCSALYSEQDVCVEGAHCGQ